jgi:hypothetical protein
VFDDNLMQMSTSRRAVYAARFLKPPGFFKRAIMRDKPRVMTGPYENPIRKLVRLREKAREFEDIPPPRKVPVAKPPPPSTFLQPVQGVPRVRPEVLQARLDFLLSDRAIQQQMNAPLLPGQTPYTAEFNMWERQMRDLRKIYRAQYLQKLEEVTAEESRKEQALFLKEQEEKRQRRLEKAQQKSIEMKRAALLLDRKRVESKVNETIEMTRRSRLKMNRLRFLKSIQDLGGDRPIVTDKNVETVFPDPSGDETVKGPTTGNKEILNRNVSVPFLTRQLGGAVDLPKRKNLRIHKVENVYREILEKSYDFHPELESDHVEKSSEDLFPVSGLSPQQRAELYYSNFTMDEKLELIDQKIHMLQERQMVEEMKGSTDPLTVQLMDLLAAAKAAHLEKEQVETMEKNSEKDDSS